MFTLDGGERQGAPAKPAQRHASHASHGYQLQAA